MFDENIRAELIWDGTDEVRIPSTMEDPAPGQMVGTAHARVGEVALRVCYESMGIDPITGKPKGRTSEKSHEHIRQVKNHSVYEHCTFTMEIFGVDVKLLALAFINRPGIWFRGIDDSRAEVTLNHRCVLEWDSWSQNHDQMDPQSLLGTDRLGGLEKTLGAVLHNYAMILAPPLYSKEYKTVDNESFSYIKTQEKTENLTQDQAWVSLYLSGSRGFGNEQVRHGDWSGISQRCLAGDSLITCVHISPTTGKMSGPILGKRPRTIENLYEMLHNPRLKNQVFKMYVRTLDESTGLFTASKISDIEYSGVKECFEVTLEDGKTVKCTKDHRIMTNQGWKTLDEIVHPKLVGVDTVQWDKNNPFTIGVNGVSVVGLGLYRDIDWMRQKFVEEGLSYEEIAEEAGCSVELVRLYTLRLGLREKKFEFSKDNLYLYKDSNWLFQRYHVEGKSLQEMADECHCSIHVIRTYLNSNCYSKERSEINRGKIPWNKGISYSKKEPYSQESIEKYRLSKLGEKNPMWKGGKGTAERRSFQGWKKENRKFIFERDGYRCRLCNRHSSEIICNSKHRRKRAIEVHHIIPIWNRPNLACDINNVATICWECHCKVLQGHELEYVDFLQEAIQSHVKWVPSDKERPPQKFRSVKIHYKKIVKVIYCGPIETFDLVLEGENHGFVANGVVVHNSTRFVDETDTPYIRHPLISHFLEDPEVDYDLKQVVSHKTEFSQSSDRSCYIYLVETLQDYLKKHGVEGTSARKQARGAARGYLGNALFTDMVFSANVRQWRWILSQRAAAPADAEIRVLYAPQVLRELRKSRYEHFFRDLELAPAPDGIGQIVVFKS